MPFKTNGDGTTGTPLLKLTISNFYMPLSLKPIEYKEAGDIFTGYIYATDTRCKRGIDTSEQLLHDNRCIEEYIPDNVSQTLTMEIAAQRLGKATLLSR